MKTKEKCSKEAFKTLPQSKDAKVVSKRRPETSANTSLKSSANLNLNTTPRRLEYTLGPMASPTF